MGKSGSVVYVFFFFYRSPGFPLYRGSPEVTCNGSYEILPSRRQVDPPVVVDITSFRPGAFMTRHVGHVGGYHDACPAPLC